MQLTFLGTGTSTGVPTIGCHCTTCSSTDPRDQRLRTSALLTDGNRRLLIDCGPDLRQQLLTNHIDALDACIITHYHYDHVGGIDDLRKFSYPNGFDIYANADTIGVLRSNVPYCFAEHPYPGAPVLHPHVLEPFQSCDIAGFNVVPLPINHYLMDILGFKIGNLAYITDAKVIPTETIEAIRGIDTLVVNALRPKEHISHMNLTDALNVINVVKPRQAWLVHICHDMGLYAERNPSLPDGVNLAYDNLTIEIP